MDSRHIEELLERYWACETTLEEEVMLRRFFCEEDCCLIATCLFISRNSLKLI